MRGPARADASPGLQNLDRPAKSEGGVMHSYLIRISIIVATLVGLSLVISTFASSEPSDADQVVAANFSYYAALSARDLSAMERVWAQGPHDVNVAPPIKPEAHTGWNTIRKNYQTFWATL